MKNIFRQGAIILVFFCAWNLIFLFLSYFFYPECRVINNYNSDKIVGVRNDTLRNNIFQDEVTNSLMGFWVSRHDPKRIIIIGSSNAGGGIDSSILQTILPDFTVHNACVRSSNITQLSDIVNEVLRSNHGAMKGTIFIIGIHYASFVNDNVKLGHILWKNQNFTYVQLEGVRYGLFRVKDNNLEPVLTPYLMPLAVHLLRPYLFWNIIFTHIESYYHAFWDYLKPPRIKYQEKLKGEQYKQYALAYWKDLLGNVKDFAEDPQMNDFWSLCKKIEQSGGAIVIVDLPTPPWLRERSVYYKKYILKRTFLLNEIEKIPRLRYIDLSTNLPKITDSDFKDSAHPTREAAILWSKTVADFVVSQRQFLGF